MAPKQSADWKGEGYHRLTLELPKSVWDDLLAWASANGLRGSQAIRTLLIEKLREKKEGK